MTPEIFSTRGFRPQDQLEAWREWYSSVFEVTPKDQAGDEFASEIRLWNLGGLAMTRTPLSVSRLTKLDDASTP